MIPYTEITPSNLFNDGMDILNQAVEQARNFEELHEAIVVSLARTKDDDSASDGRIHANKVSHSQVSVNVYVYVCRASMRSGSKWVPDPNGTLYQVCRNLREQENTATVVCDGTDITPSSTQTAAMLPIPVGAPVNLYPAGDGDYEFEVSNAINWTCSP